MSAEGSFPEKLTVPYGELASFSPNGNKLAYITKITENYPFKRYQGGLASDVILYDLGDDTAERITDYPGNDGKPAWVGDRVYFVSDRGPDYRLNVWSYDTGSGEFGQITQFTDFDISFMSAGPEDLVFEAGGRMHLMDFETDEVRPVDVHVVSDLAVEMARSVDVSERIRNMAASPEGRRVVFEARGELFNVPSSEGFVLNTTRSSGAFDRDPAWSPDGSTIAFWSDRSGEYEIWTQPSNGAEPAKQVTSRGTGFGYSLYWSPDSEKLAFIDETNDIVVVDVASGELWVAGSTYWNVGHGGRQSYPIAWSPDSRWIAFTQGVENSHGAIVLYDVVAGVARQATSGFYDDSNPVFSTDGDYLFYLTDREMSAAYSALGDGTWVYPNATRIASVGLTADVPSLLPARNDELDADDEAEEAETEGPEAEAGPGEDVADGPSPVEVDFEGFESRLVLLPPDAGNIGDLMPFEGKLANRRFANTGSGGGPPSLMYYDLAEREEETIIEGVSDVAMTADGGSLLVSSEDRYGIVQPEPDQEIEDPIPTDGLVMDLVPREEWRQIFADTWRRYRDFFYDPAMHGVDWDELRERYGALIEEARTRWDVTFVQSEMQAELSAGHTYTGGGDAESVTPVGTGYLGIDWELADDR